MKRHRILLADDSPTIRRVVELTFEDEGIDVFAVADGDAAMKTFVEIEPDLVIADVNMPGMSGYQFCEMIKQDESTMHTPVILLVGSFEPFDAGEASRVGSNYYFTKPFTSIREVVSKVKEYLELGAFDASGPELTDIDDLYSESIVEETTPTSAANGSPIEFEDTLDDLPYRDTKPDEDLGSIGEDDELIETQHFDNELTFSRSDVSSDPFFSHADSRVQANATPITEIAIEEKPEAETDASAENAEEVLENADEVSNDGTISLESSQMEAIVQAVMERMSAEAVKEIARKEVPKITEKLIREALAEENKLS